jgi:hypothetical protein
MEYGLWIISLHSEDMLETESFWHKLLELARPGRGNPSLISKVTLAIRYEHQKRKCG